MGLSAAVVICTRNRPTLLGRCLDAVLRLDFPRFDILVVDNAPVDGSTAAVAAQKGVRYVVERRVGLNRARNMGAECSDSDIVAYLDDDAIPQSTWLSSILEPFQDPQVMAAAGRCLPYSLETEAEKLCETFWQHDLGLEERRVDQQVSKWFELANFGGVGIGANMAFRRSSFKFGGIFNERLDRGTPLFGFGEHYAFFSLVHHGYRVVYAPDARVSHPYPASMPDLRKRHLRDLTSSAGYLLFLLLEHPRYRISVLRFIVDAVRKRAFGFPRKEKNLRLRLAPPWRVGIAIAEGGLRYVQSLFYPSRTRTPGAILFSPSPVTSGDGDGS